MLRTALILLSTALAGGTALLGRQIPVRANMKGPTQILAGVSFFFLLFFVRISFVDSYFWWSAPAVGFICAIFYGLQRLNDIDRLIDREKPYRWLTEVQKSMPVTGAPMTAEQLQEALAAYDSYHDEHPEPQERRFLDDFFIADEADIKGLASPTQVELERLDSFIFTARHGYLVHDHSADQVPCDVMTIHPGMSIADIVDAAKLHKCIKEIAA